MKYQRITFRPLSRNRFRCNQTGAIVKASKTESYRNMFLASAERRPPKSGERQVEWCKCGAMMIAKNKCMNDLCRHNLTPIQKYYAAMERKQTNSQKRFKNTRGFLENL